MLRGFGTYIHNPYAMHELWFKKGGHDVRVCRRYVDVQAPLSSKGFSAVLTINFFVDSLFPFMNRPHMFRHVSLSRKHFVTVWAGNTLDPAVLCFSQVHVSDVRTEIGLSGENPDAKMASLVGRICFNFHGFFINFLFLFQAILVEE